MEKTYVTIQQHNVPAEHIKEVAECFGLEIQMSPDKLDIKWTEIVLPHTNIRVTWYCLRDEADQLEVG